MIEYNTTKTLLQKLALDLYLWQQGENTNQFPTLDELDQTEQVKNKNIYVDSLRIANTITTVDEQRLGVTTKKELFSAIENPGGLSSLELFAKPTAELQKYLKEVLDSS